MTTATREACRRGHPLTPENVYLRPGGWRECRTCKAASAARYRPHRTDRPQARPHPLPAAWESPDRTRGSSKPIVKVREIGPVRDLTETELTLAHRLVARTAPELLDMLGLIGRTAT